MWRLSMSFGNFKNYNYYINPDILDFYSVIKYPVQNKT